jgi:hypothetical protein
MSEHTPTRPPFTINGAATIKHLNVRKEGPDDDKVLAVDIKMEFEKIDRRICAYFDDALEAFLWRGETDALIARNAYLEPVKYFNEIKDAQVEIGDRTFVGCKVGKFAIEPRDGGVIWLTLSVCAYPSKTEVSMLAGLYQEICKVRIEGPPDLFTQPQTESE